MRADISLTREGKRVVSGRFEAYRCNIVALDHLLAGLAKNIIEVHEATADQRQLAVGLTMDFPSGHSTMELASRLGVA